MPDTVMPVEMRDIVYAVGGKRLIDGLSLRLAPHTRTVIMGPNGAGKSLTLRLLQGLLVPESGDIRWGADRDVDRSAAVGRHDVAMVFQRPVLLRRSAAANLRHALRVCGVTGSAQSRRTEELLAMGGLGVLRDRPARVLSAGEQQRLSLVRALAGNPLLLLLDEPTANLDPVSTQAIEALVNQAHAAGTKIVFVTHDRDQAARLADDVVFMESGKAVEAASAATFFARPITEAARAYLAGRLYITEES
jgi:tungstate transport system ATP-binding protein